MADLPLPPLTPQALAALAEVNKRQADPEYMARLAPLINDNKKILDLLEEGGD